MGLWPSELLMKWMTLFIVFYLLNKATMNGKIVIIKAWNLISKHWFAANRTSLTTKTRCKSKLKWDKSSIGATRILKSKDSWITLSHRMPIVSNNLLTATRKCKLIQLLKKLMSLLTKDYLNVFLALIAVSRALQLYTQSEAPYKSYTARCYALALSFCGTVLVKYGMIMIWWTIIMNVHIVAIE